MRLTLFLFPLLAVGLLAGCSSSSKRKTTDPYAGGDGFCTQWAKAACNSTVVSNCAAADAAACIAKQTSYCLGRLPPHYDSTNAKACVEAVKKAFSDAKLTKDEIEVVRNFGAPCDKLNKGPGVESDTCFDSNDCNSLEDFSCITKPGAGGGTCQVAVVVAGGQSCAAANQTCDVGLYCSTTSTGANCLARQGAGATCDPNLPCLEDFQCLGATGSMTCAEKGNDTDSCSSDDQCKSGICAQNAAGGGTCVPQVVLAPTEPMCADLR